jgi:hypothetical protein
MTLLAAWRGCWVAKIFGVLAGVSLAGNRSLIRDLRIPKELEISCHQIIMILILISLTSMSTAAVVSSLYTTQRRLGRSG